MDITSLSAAELSETIHARTVSCHQVMDAFINRINRRNPVLNAIVSMRDSDALLREAAVLDAELAAGQSRGWMHGMPQAIKDMAETEGLRTTLGSRLMADNIPKRDGLTVSRMRAAGCVIVGKTNVPEFGLGSHTFNDVFGTTVNPYDITRSAGGSSGGAAVALASRMLPVADGSDYMGSLRNPAGWCNVFGFRPSLGRVPLYPARDAYIGLATEGPMARTVVDLAMLLGTQAGYDERVPLSLSGRLPEFDSGASTRQALCGDITGTRVGWLGDLDGYLAMERGILDRCTDGLRRLESVGCTVEPASFNMEPGQIWDAALVWRQMHFASGIGPMITEPWQRDLAKPELLWEIDQGRLLEGERMLWASMERTSYFHRVVSMFQNVDVLAIPSAQVWPFPAIERWPTHIGEREMDSYHRWMEVSVYATFAGLPAVSVPVGFDERGLPMGMQLIGRPRGDVELLRIAHAYESTIAELHIGQA